MAEDSGWPTPIVEFIQKILKDEPAALVALLLVFVLFVDHLELINLQVIHNDARDWAAVALCIAIGLFAAGKIVDFTKHLFFQHRANAPLKSKLEKLRLCSDEKKVEVLFALLDDSCDVEISQRSEIINELIADGILEDNDRSILNYQNRKVEESLLKYLNKNPKIRDSILKRNELEQPARNLIATRKRLNQASRNGSGNGWLAV